MRTFYSVAEHSVRVMSYVGRCGPYVDRVLRAALLHDASEAYLSDISRPIKQHSSLGAIYREVEEGLMQAISKRFGFDWPANSVIAEADNALLFAEVRDLMPSRRNVREAMGIPEGEEDDLLQYEAESPYRETISPWSPTEAQYRFLRQFHSIYY